MLWIESKLNSINIDAILAETNTMKYLSALLLSLFFLSSYGQKQIKLEELKDHIGDSVEVKGKISGVRYLETAKNTPTFINIGGVYPNQLLTVVIWGDVRKQLDYAPEDKKFAGGMAIVTGKVELYKDKPQIVIKDPKQLRIVYDEEVPADQVPAIEKKKGN
jgi:DNA/RNA endonuclease YhcR with UshA esterase domain